MSASAEFIARSTRPALRLPLTTLNVLKFDLNDIVRAIVDNEFQKRRVLEELARLDDGDQSQSSKDSAASHADSWCCCEECGRDFARETVNRVRRSGRITRSLAGRKRKHAPRAESDGMDELDSEG